MGNVGHRHTDKVEASYDHDLNLPFVLRPEDLRKLYDIAQGSAGECEIVMQCRDGVERRPADLDESLEYANATDREIQKLALEGRRYTPSTHIRIELSSGFFHTVSVRIRAEESLLVQIRDKVDVVLKGMRPWYAPVARRDVFGTIQSVFFLLYMTVLVSLFVTLPDTKLFSQAEMTKLRSSALIFFGLAWPATWGLNKLRARIFPDACFAIGQGERRYSTRELIRWSVVVAFAVSMISGLLLMTL